MTNLIAPLIDTHAHLDDEQFAGDVEAVIDRAKSAGVNRIINIGYRPARWRTTLALADRRPEIAYALGLHPHHVDEWSTETETELLRLLAEQRPVALGEIGLDYFRNLNPPELQRRVFARQLEIAASAGLPVIIHQRHAEQVLMHILRSAPPDLVCVLHSFDGTAELAGFALERDWFFGIGGLMTRAGSTELRAVIDQIPLDHIVLETDSPYLVPAGIKSRRNEPSNVRAVAERLASERNLPLDVIVAGTSASAERLFGLRVAAAGVDGRND